MNFSKFPPDDPRLTAYALGELEGAERAAVEAALRDDPAVRAVVEEIRATAALLSSALAEEAAADLPTGAPAPREKAAIIHGSDYRKLDGGPLGKLITFPRFYYVVGGLAAACFAVVVALHPPEPRPAPKVYAEVALAPAKEARAMEASMDTAEKKEAARPQPAEPMPAPMALPPPPSVMTADSAVPQAVMSGVQDQRRDETSRRMLAVKAKDARAKLETLAFNEEKPVSSFARKRVDVSGQATEAGMEIQRVPANLPAANTEAYAYVRDNDFVGAAENLLSTFSVDVDTASYANLRRFIQGGRLPPSDAVRVEELVNYFPYHYSPPGGDGPFAASMEVADAPWAPTHRLVRIGLKGREVSTATRAAANLVFLIDVSGSMNEPTKLPLVKEAMRLLVGKLRPDDRVAIVVYAGASGLALPSTPVAKAPEILGALDALTPGGATNGALGLQLAYDIAKANFVPSGVNRVILCTDGDFNVGVTSEGELTRLIQEKAKSGVFLTALGFGMGNYKDATLERLADQGNGNYGYIDTRREAEKLLVEQVNGTLVTIAKDVKLQVEFNPAQVASYRLIGYEDRLLKKEDFNNDAVDAGEIGAGHTVTALYEIVPSENSKPETRNPKPAALLTLKVRYKEPAGTVSLKREFPLTDDGARFAAASADFKFAAAVAEFGMILRDSPHKGTGTLDQVIAWAEAGTDSDAGGYRGEFVELVRQAEVLMR